MMRLLKKIAQSFNGTEYPFYRNAKNFEQWEKIAKDNNILIIYGDSDDRVMLCGAIHDQLCGDDGSDYTKDSRQVLEDERLKTIVAEELELKALWCGQIVDDKNDWDKPYSVENIVINYENKAYRDIPFSFEVKQGAELETFKVMEDGRIQCVGMVIQLKSKKSLSESLEKLLKLSEEKPEEFDKLIYEIADSLEK